MINFQQLNKIATKDISLINKEINKISSSNVDIKELIEDSHILDMSVLDILVLYGEMFDEHYSSNPVLESIYKDIENAVSMVIESGIHNYTAHSAAKESLTESYEDLIQWIKDFVSDMSNEMD